MDNSVMTYLATIASCSATFIAIIGGMIANKAISDAAEKEVIENQINNIDVEIKQLEQELQNVKKTIAESKAKEFILKNMNDLLHGKDIEKVLCDKVEEYDEYKKQFTSYWEKALGIVKGDKKENYDDFEYWVSVNSNYQKLNNSYGQAGSDIMRISLLKNNLMVSDQQMHFSRETKKDMIQCSYNNALQRKKQLQEQEEKIMKRGKSIWMGIIIFIMATIIDVVFPIMYLYDIDWTSCDLIENLLIAKIPFVNVTIANIVLLAMTLYICMLFPRKRKRRED